MGHWRLDAKLPELLFINGLVAYLTTAVESLPDASAAVRKLKQYGQTQQYVDDQSRAVALQLSGMLESQEAEVDFREAFYP